MNIEPFFHLRSSPSGGIIFLASLINLGRAQPLNYTERELTPKQYDTEFQKSLHLSAALAGLITLIIIQYHLRTSGYKLSRSPFRSSDCLNWIAMIVIAVFWTTFVFLSAFVFEDKPCSSENASLWPCMGRLAFVPWFLFGGSIWWLWCQVIYTCTRPSIKRVLHKRELKKSIWEAHIPDQEWFLDDGPEFTFFNPGFYRKGIEAYMRILIIVCVVLTTIGAFKAKFYTLAMLNIAAVFMFLFAQPRDDFDLDCPHKSYLDDLRTPMLDTTSRSMVYVLPSQHSNFQVQFFPRIKSETEVLDANRAMFEPLDCSEKNWSLELCRNAMRKIMATWTRNILLTNVTDIDCLANKMYNHLEDEQNNFPGSSTTNESAEDVGSLHLIGRDIIVALLLWDELLFQWRHKLDNGYREEIWKLRSPKYHMYLTPGHVPSPVLGQSRGLNGLTEAAQAVYNIMRANRETASGHFQLPTADIPAKSVVFGSKRFNSLEDYASELWDRCWETDPTTFGALFLWSTVWYMDNGNGRDYQVSPFTTINSVTADFSYPTYWRLTWRHVWNSIIVCQLVVMLPSILSSFFSFF